MLELLKIVLIAVIETVSTKMLELLNSPLLSHILYLVVKKQVDIL